MDFKKPKVFKLSNILLITSVICCFTAIETYAQDFIYSPKNPAFGGNSLNFSAFLNIANQQNKFQNQTDRFRRDPLADFEASLQRQVLSQLTREIIGNRFGADINLQEQNNFEFGEFNVSINPGSDGVSINISNILTGESTSITIPSGF